MKACSIPALLLGLTPLAVAQTYISAVLNGASYSALLSPGCWAVVFGDKLAANAEAATSVPLPHTLAGVSVTVDGIAAPLLYVSPKQINFLIPYEVLPPRFGMPSQVVVSNQGSQSFSYAIQLSREAPALFTRDANGTGPALLFDSNFVPVRTVAAGDTAVFYAAGLGPTNPPPASDTGATPSGPPLRATDDIEVYIGEQKLTPDQVLFVGLAPGFPGVYQVNVRIPSGLATDRLYLKAGGWQSNIAEFGISAGGNVANVTGAVVGLYPPAPPNTPPYDLPSQQPFAENSIALQAAAFTVSFDVLPGARPFTVAAVGEAGSAIIQVDPASGSWQSSATVPSLATRFWSFSVGSPDLVLLDFYTCTAGARCDPFLNNSIPISQVGLVEIMAQKLLPAPQDLGPPKSLVGFWHSSGSASPGSRVNISVPDELRFGGWLHFPWGPFPTHTSTFKLYVDGNLIASQDAVYKLRYRTNAPATGPVSQAITFGALSDVTLGVAPFTISATASSGLPVIFTSTTPSVCTISGNTVTILAVGTCSILTSQPGNSNYTAATPVTQSFIVMDTSTGFPVIYSNFGPAMSFDTNPSHAWTINGYVSATVGQQALSERFTPSADYTFTAAKVAVALNGGPNGINVFLQADSNGQPGRVIEEIPLAGLGVTPAVFTASSTQHPILQRGTPYWLTLVAGAAGVTAGWFWNSIGDASNSTGLTVTQGGSPSGPWPNPNSGPVQTRGAFEIDDAVSPSGMDTAHDRFSLDHPNRQ